MSGVEIARDALVHFLGAHASRQHAAAALEVWRIYHGWVLSNEDIPAVLDHFDPSPWPANLAGRSR